MALRPPTALVAAAVSLAACSAAPEAVETGCEAATWFTDWDGDGYGDAEAPVTACVQPGDAVDDATDCDDGNAAVHPNQDEVWYDGYDQDCDGGNDYDADGDLWLDAEEGGGGDCDDTDPSVNPDAVEVWYDGVDQDCDEADDYDVDGDGHQAEVAGGGDCDDADAARSPDADEICDDGVDNDCDGTAGACAPSGELSLAEAVAFLGEGYQHAAGFSLAGVGDMDGDGDGELALPTVGDSRGEALSGTVHLVFGPALAGGSLADADARLLGEDVLDRVGYAVVGLGDANGDGLADLATSAPFRSEEVDDGGLVYVVLGPVSGERSLSQADGRLSGDRVGALAGTALAGGGDVDGDGWVDLLVGAAEDGAAWLALGPLTGAVSLGDAAAVIEGDGDGSAAGTAIGGGGDLDGDGYDDVAIGAPGQVSLGVDAAGAVAIFLGPIDDAAAVLAGSAEDEAAGSAVAIAGDLDGDGYDDLIVGAPYSAAGGTDAGAALIILGPVDAGAQEAWDAAVTRVLGDGEDDNCGASVAAAGDVDGDGRDELLVGAPYEDSGGSQAGAAYLIFGTGL